MRTILLLALILAAGCVSDSRPTPPKASFTLDAPASLELFNGETVKRDVAVNWEKGEREDLEVSAAVEPDGKGVSAKVEPAKLERGVGPIQVTISATERAAPGDYTLTLTAKAKGGATAKGTITVKVPRRE